MKTNNKISAYILCGSTAALLFSCVIVALCLAVNNTGGGRYHASGAGPTPTPTCAPPPPNMVSWWPGDGNTDDIIDGNSGSFVGTANYATGKVGQAFSFNGSNYVNVPDAANLDFEGAAPITVDMWVYRTSDDPVMHFIGKREVQCGLINYQMALDFQGLSFGGHGGGVVTGQNLPLNTWTHLAGTFDGSAVRFYINGTLAGTSPATSLGPTNNAPLQIGNSGSCAGGGFGGLIDEVDIFNRALSQAEIQAIYNAGSAGKCTLSVINSDPACGSTILKQLTDFVINLAEPVQPATVQASDFTVNGTPANSFTLFNGNTTIIFHYNNSPVVTQGVQTMHIPAGAFVRDPDGQPVREFTCPFRYDATLLAVTTTIPPVGGTFSPPAPGTYEYDVNWNEAIDPTSVQASDLTPGGNTGATVTNVELINGNTTIRFTLNILFGGSLTADIVAGAITDQFGNPNAAFSGNYTVKGPLSPCDPRPPNLVSWWPGDDNTNDIIDGNNGLFVGDPAYSTGEVGRAFRFNVTGANSVQVPDAANLDFAPNAPITIDMWVYRLTPLPIMHFIGKRVNCGTPNYEMGINMSNGEGLSWGALHTGQDLPQHIWTHLAGTFDGSTFRLYINGALAGTAPGTLGPPNNAILRIGDSGTGFGCGGFVGLMDEVDIFNRALSQSEIQAIYNAGSAGKCRPVGTPTPTPTASPTPTSPPTCHPLPSNVVSWWPGDSNTDDIIDGNNGAFVGNISYATGEVGQAFRFDGSNYVQVPDAANLDFAGAAPITIDMWVYRTSNAPRMSLIGKRISCGGTSTSNYEMSVDTLSDAGLRFGGDDSEVHTGQDLPLNTWTHLAGTFDGSTLRFYINGTLEGTAAATSLGPVNNAHLRIGTSGDCEKFGGLIDEVDIFNRALSQSEIQTIYNAGSAGKCRPRPSPTARPRPTPAPRP